ncbi:MAG: radical SAM protein [Vulcanimicrobiota bacterium]
MSTIGLILTYACPLQCRHCFAVKPENATLDMSMDDVTFYIDMIASSGKFTSVCFSGGEPFIREELLGYAVSYAAGKGLRASVITSAFWAESREKAVEKLSHMKGLDELHLSSDVFHREFVPDSYIRNAIIAAKDIGVWAVTVNVTSSQEEEREEILANVSDIIPSAHVTRQDPLPKGRGRGLPAEQFRMGRSETPCEDIEYKAIDTRGFLTACCGPVYDLPASHPLILGNVRECSLSSLLDKENIIFEYLRLKGPWTLASLLEKAELHQFDDTYVRGCACDLCIEILSNKSFTEALQTILRNEQAEEARLFNLFSNRLNML